MTVAGLFTISELLIKRAEDGNHEPSYCGRAGGFWRLKRESVTADVEAEDQKTDDIRKGKPPQVFL